MSEGVISSVEINFESNSCYLDESSRLLTEKTRPDGLVEAYRVKQKNTGQQVAAISLNRNSADAQQAQYYIDRFERETLRCSCSQQSKGIRRLDRGRYKAHYLYAVFETADVLAAGRETTVIRMSKKPEQLHGESVSSKQNDMCVSFLSNVLAAVPLEHYFSEPDQNYEKCMNDWYVRAA